MEKTLIEQFLVHISESTLSCMKKLDANAHKILFVVDDNQTLVGSVTDGDIRRWILAGNDLNDEISKVCHKNPITSDNDYSHSELKEKMLSNKLECIPILDVSRKIESVVFWTDLFGEGKITIPKRKLTIPVVLMAGGFGTRLKPFTTILPKPLIPIGSKSIAEHIIDKFTAYGINEFFITLNHRANIIKSYFDYVEKEYTLDYAVEEKPLGTAGGIKLLADKLPDTFIVTNCDIIIDADYAEIVDFHNESKNDITLVSSMMHYQIPYGICEIDKGGKLIEIREKPEYNFLISTGMYILNRNTLDLIPDYEFYHITHLIEKIKANDGIIGVYPISENSWDDTGQWDEYNKTVKKLSNDQ